MERFTKIQAELLKEAVEVAVFHIIRTTTGRCHPSPERGVGIAHGTWREGAGFQAGVCGSRS